VAVDTAADNAAAVEVVVADIVAVVRVEAEVGKFVEVEVGKFEEVVMGFVGFG
jgi:hypothetical protein